MGLSEYLTINFSTQTGTWFPRRTCIHAFGFKTTVLKISWYAFWQRIVDDWTYHTHKRCIVIVDTLHANIVGGCFLQGGWLRNTFRWRESIGPWEERPGHFGDCWNYWTDDGLGYFEFLQVPDSLFRTRFSLDGHLIITFEIHIIAF